MYKQNMEMIKDADKKAMRDELASFASRWHEKGLSAEQIYDMLLFASARIGYVRLNKTIVDFVKDCLDAAKFAQLKVEKEEI